jgi:Zn-dependent protease
VDFFGENWLASRVMIMVPVILSLSVHEWAHAYTAFRLGDDTAARMGRLTLNPIAHIDPIGLLLPLMGVPFGWAKPVPINISRFDRSVDLRTGLILTAAAGPISNLVLALGATLLMGLGVRFGLVEMGGLMAAFSELFILINLVLALFNMLPIPPLDGSRVFDGLCPDALRPAWNAFARVGPFGLLLVIVAPLFLGFSLIAWPLAQARAAMAILFDVIAG